MKSGILILFVFAGFALLTFSVPNSDAMRMIWGLDQMIERSDVIVIGTVENTWVDVRPFEDHKIVDTATVKVDEWLKNKKDSDILEIRYYGDWSQKIENLLGIHRSDTPVHNYKPGEKVLVLASYEKPTMVMGEGHYPFYEGKHVILDETVRSQNGEQMKLDTLRQKINNTLTNKSNETSLSEDSDSIPVKVVGSTAYQICSDLALECDHENMTTSYDGIKQSDEIIVSLSLEGRGQNYMIYLDADAVENMDGNYIKNIDVTTENRQAVDYSVDNAGKIDLFKIPLPINEKYDQSRLWRVGIFGCRV